MKVDFVPFLQPGLHPGMDALARGLAAGVSGRGGELRIRSESFAEAVLASERGEAEVLFLFVTDPMLGSEEVKGALDSGMRVFTFHQPNYEVSGSVLVPNFYQGVELARQMGGRLGRGGRIAILGGPRILDDEELVLGCLDGARRAGLEVLNDPFEDQYRNLEDVKGASKQVVERLMADCYPFDGLIVFNDETLHDVVEYLDAKELLGTFPIVSRNGTPEVIEFVRRGISSATLDYCLPEIGRLGAELLDGRETVLLAPVGQVFGAGNLADYVPWESRVADDTPFTIL